MRSAIGRRGRWQFGHPATQTSAPHQAQDTSASLGGPPAGAGSGSRPGVHAGGAWPPGSLANSGLRSAVEGHHQEAVGRAFVGQPRSARLQRPGAVASAPRRITTGKPGLDRRNDRQPGGTHAKFNPAQPAASTSTAPDSGGADLRSFVRHRPPGRTEPAWRALEDRGKGSVLF